MQVGYDRTFGRHSVSGMLLFEDQHKVGDNFYGSREVVLPMDQVFVGDGETQQFNQSSGGGSLYDYAYQSLAGRFNYDFGGKYLAEFVFRYDASSRFPSGDLRWVFFPSVSVGWRISEENFWKESSLDFIENLKIRASYGKTGYDGDLNYEFLTGFTYPSGGAILGGDYVNGSVPKGIANKDITWQTIKMFDIGLDFSAWNGKLGLTFDYFRRHRDGLYARRNLSLPGSVGASLPLENLNSDRDTGFELELSHRNRVGDFSYAVKGNVSFTRRKTLYYEQLLPELASEQQRPFQQHLVGLRRRRAYHQLGSVVLQSRLYRPRQRDGRLSLRGLERRRLDQRPGRTPDRLHGYGSDGQFRSDDQRIVERNRLLDALAGVGQTVTSSLASFCRSRSGRVPTPFRNTWTAGIRPIRRPIPTIPPRSGSPANTAIRARRQIPTRSMGCRMPATCV